MALDPIALKQTEDILRHAHAQGREMLFEHEVYDILDGCGLDTPTRFLVRKPSEISSRLLTEIPGDRVVLKIVSPAITHKGNVGGVKIAHKDRDYVRYVFDEMLAHFTAMDVAIEGILVVEMVDYCQSLGNEILLGFRESEAFGPVLTFTKGGADAEHFATHFSAPNLILAPIDRNWTQALLESTHIQKKFVAEGKTDHVDRIVSASSTFSDLSVAFSNYFDTDTDFTIREFEVNPFVFTRDGRFLAIDGFATFGKKGTPADLDFKPMASMKPFFDPEGVAVVGISSTNNAKPGNIIVGNLVRMERDDIYCVNAKGGRVSVEGREFDSFPKVTDIPHTVDLAVITVPAGATLEVVEECAAKGVKAIVLIPGGFSETESGKGLEEEISAITEKAGIRVIGPNCLGIIHAGSDAAKGLNTFFIPREKFAVGFEKKTNVAILSQSGALGITEIDNLKNAISPRVIVSYGNQLDVDPCDLVAHFQEDPGVDVIGCYIEGFKEDAGRKLFNVIGKSTKPVIVYKAGRTEAGRQATESHTASIAGEYAVSRAAMKQAGAIVAETMIDHGDFIKTFALLTDFQVPGKRVAIIANAGYEKTLAADNLQNLELASLHEKTLADLAEILPPMVDADPLLDLTPMADDEIYAKSIEILLQSSAVDALLVSIVPQSAVIHTTDDEIRNNPDNIANRIIDLVHKYKKPVVVSMSAATGAGAVYNEIARVLENGGVPTYLTANRAMKCLNAFIKHRLSRTRCNYSEWLQ